MCFLEFDIFFFTFLPDDLRRLSIGMLHVSIITCGSCIYNAICSGFSAASAPAVICHCGLAMMNPRPLGRLYIMGPVSTENGAHHVTELHINLNVSCLDQKSGQIKHRDIQQLVDFEFDYPWWMYYSTDQAQHILTLLKFWLTYFKNRHVCRFFFF